MCAHAQGMPQGEVNGVNFQFLPGYPHNTSCLEEAGVRSADAIIIGPADDLSDKEVRLYLLYVAHFCTLLRSSLYVLSQGAQHARA